MRLVAGMLGLLCIVFASAIVDINAQVKPKGFLADVKTVFVDETSFEIIRSSCERTYGGTRIVCQKHLDEREEFLTVVKRWLVKSGFAVNVARDEADAILQGELRMNDLAGMPSINADRKTRRANEDFTKWADWEVTAWMLNQADLRLWTLRDEWEYPKISYSASGLAKIEGKKLALAVKHDVKKASK